MTPTDFMAEMLILFSWTRAASGAWQPPISGRKEDA